LIALLILMPFRMPSPADDEGSDWVHTGSESYYEVSLSTSSGVTTLAPGSTCEVQVELPSFMQTRKVGLTTQTA
jgi:hypothetical protein